MSANVIAGFRSEQAFKKALNAAKTLNLGGLETFTPMPSVPGRSILPTVILIAGVLGTLASFLLQTYANVWAYPIDIGGRPGFSWPAFIPIAFENGVLVAILTGFFGYFIANRMPRLYERIDESSAVHGAMRDVWCVHIRTAEPHRALAAMWDHAPDVLEEINE